MPSSSESQRAHTTRQRIIRSAERLFAQKGFKAMTLRDVTREARVNLAAVNYHFGSKRELIREVVGTRFTPINEERMRLLNQSVEHHSPGPVPLREIFEAVFRPLFTAAMTTRGPDRVLMQMIGRSLSEPSSFLRDMHAEFFADLSRRFLVELKRALPDLPDDELYYRFFVCVSAMIGVISEQVILESLSNGQVDPDDIDRLAGQLIDFAAAGFGRP